MIKNLKNKKKGFTLIELIIVIAIIAILAAVAIPKFGDVKKKANESADLANAKTIHSAASIAIAESDTTITDVKDLVENVPAVVARLEGVPTPKVGAGTNKFVVEIKGSTVKVYRGADKTATDQIYPEQ